MAHGWTREEWGIRRRLVQFWRRQDGHLVRATFRPVLPAELAASASTSIVISCIFREDKNECFVTSVDTIYLLEALVGARFSVEEKNRIRRNLEGFKPITVSKSKPDSEDFFKLIMVSKLKPIIYLRHGGLTWTLALVVVSCAQTSEYRKRRQGLSLANPFGCFEEDYV
jgi:hypothetical protein